MQHSALALTLSATLFSASLFVTGHATAQTKVACVGDSITYGHGLPGDKTYPTDLQALLGSDYTVGNFGHSGATLSKNGDLPYWTQAEFAASDTFAPDTVVIMLGTNDGKPQNWTTELEAEFDGDYADLVQHYRDLGAEVYIALPPPVYDPGAFSIDPATVNDDIVPHVQAVAVTVAAPVIDVFTAMSGHPELFQDTVHPTVDGAQLLAQTVYDGLILPASGGSDAGGAPSSGGSATGGSTTGGALGSGGSSATGGALGSGGSSATGGSVATGGSTGGSVTTPNSGAGGTMPGTSGGQGDSDSGCSCRVPSQSKSESGYLWALMALGCAITARKYFRS